MKKILCILCFLLMGCGNININTNIDDSLYIGINYPKTNISKLDKKIDKYVDDIYNTFMKKRKDNSELNIDYSYNIVNSRYLNIIIYTYVNNKYQVKSFIFDKKKNKFLNLDDLVTDQSKVDSLVKKEALLKKKDINLDKITYEFSFDDSNLYFYLKNYKLTIKIPLSKIPTKLNIKKDNNYDDYKVIKQTNNPIDYKKPVIALTFDDGPSKYTKEIVEYLNKNNAYATFFVIGNKVNIYKDTIRLMVKYGNEIGNHSYSHKWLTRLNDEELKYQLDETQRIIKKITGYTPVYLRPTYGSINDKLRSKTNLKIAMWDIDPMDWKYKNSNTLASKVIQKAADEKIIIMHDTKKRTLEAVKIIVDELKKQGYQFVTLSELEEVKLLRSYEGKKT